MANFNTFPKAPQNPRLDEAFLRNVVKSLNLAMDGKINCTGEFSCTASVGSTEVKNILCTENSMVLLTPTTANAALEATSGSLYVVSGDGLFTVTHDNNATTDRTFRYVVIG